jgi:hypothetical protein
MRFLIPFAINGIESSRNVIEAIVPIIIRVRDRVRDAHIERELCFGAFVGGLVPGNAEATCYTRFGCMPLAVNDPRRR